MVVAEDLGTGRPGRAAFGAGLLVLAAVEARPEGSVGRVFGRLHDLLLGPWGTFGWVRCGRRSPVFGLRTVTVSERGRRRVGGPFDRIDNRGLRGRGAPWRP